LPAFLKQVTGAAAAAADGINALITALCGEPERIVELTLVGNTAMHHIFLGLPVGQLGRAPYQPRVREAMIASPGTLDWRLHPGLCTSAVPGGGFVGSDHVAVILPQVFTQRGIRCWHWISAPILKLRWRTGEGSKAFPVPQAPPWRRPHHPRYLGGTRRHRQGQYKYRRRFIPYHR